MNSFLSKIFQILRKNSKATSTTLKEESNNIKKKYFDSFISFDTCVSFDPPGDRNCQFHKIAHALSRHGIYRSAQLLRANIVNPYRGFRKSKATSSTGLCALYQCSTEKPIKG